MVGIKIERGESGIMISFVHLSDIHFRKYSGDRYDLDEDLRNEVLLDVAHHAIGNLSNIRGVLICGDIAFGGKAEEYTAASKFLSQLCTKLNISEEAVYCVPGNHDVDQDVPRNSPAVKLLQDKLAAAADLKIFDDYLGKIYRDPKSAELIFAPIERYNTEFAGQYGCYMAPTDLDWQQTMQLSEKYNLCIMGINSTIISNEDDHASKDIERLMRIGQLQMPKRMDNTIYLTLCHHPPECWSDPESKLQKKMDDRVSLQLYGHKHLQTITKRTDSLIIGCGATHPSRWEPNWIPRYNWITLNLHSDSVTDCLNVKIYPRVLNEQECRFEEDKHLCKDKIYCEYMLTLNSSMPEDENESISDFMGEEEKKIMLNSFIARAKERQCIEQFFQEVQNAKERI